MKVWVVTDGCYSDYHVVGVCSSVEKARELTGGTENIRGGDVRIDEWELDNFEQDGPFAQAWNSGIDLATGKIQHYQFTDIQRVPLGQRAAAITVRYDGNIDVKSFVSQEHADKLAIEARQERLRNAAQTV